MIFHSYVSLTEGIQCLPKKLGPDDIFLSRVSKPIPFRKVGCSTLSSCKPRQILANHSQVWNKSRLSGVVSIPFPSMGPFCAADTWGTRLCCNSKHVIFGSYPPTLPFYFTWLAGKKQSTSSWEIWVCLKMLG